MNKQEFLAELRKGLAGLPQGDIEERVSFYEEIIDDRMEEGLSEEDAVCAVGHVDQIISQAKPVKEDTATKKRLKGWQITLLILGSPLWLPLLIAALAVMLSLYLSLWAGILSLWAVFGTVIGCAFGVAVAGVGFALSGNGLTGMAMISAGVVCAGLSIFLFYANKAATRGTLWLTKKIALSVTNPFAKKEEA